MTDSKNQYPIPQPDDELEQAIDAAQRMVEEDHNWHPVASDDLDAANPLTPRESRMVREDAASAVELHELKEARRIDELTGLRSFEVFKDELPRAIALTKRAHKAFALFEIDGKNLKEVNDNLGRSSGDAYIQLIAEALREVVRDSDGVYRGGSASDESYVTLSLISESGEELNLFLLDMQARFEYEVRQRLKEHPILNKTIDMFGTGIHCGFAAVDFSKPQTRHKSSREMADELREQADERLRHDKQVEKEHEISERDTPS